METRIGRKEKHYETLMKTEIMLGFFQHLVFDIYSSITHELLELGCRTQNHPSFIKEIKPLTVDR